MDKQVLLFDLDGTVTDPKEGITRSVQYSLQAFGIDIEDRDRLACFIGPPLRDSYKRHFGFDDDQAERAIAAYREYYAQTGMLENRLYAGMAELLARQKALGRRAALATSKPEVYARQILEHFSVLRHFDEVVGSELDGRRSDKAEVIREALLRLGNPAPGTCLMIGDTVFDIAGAASAGIDGVGVLYGYGDRRDMEAAGTIHICADVPALAAYLEP